MESNKKLVNVRIFGQEYPIRASSNEDYIKEVAAYVDKKMHEVQRSVPSSMNASKIAILEDKPILLDYWTDSQNNQALIGVKQTEDQEKILIKNDYFIINKNLSDELINFSPL